MEKNDSYDENDIHTEKNIYGISKSLGEPENNYIRTSIIREEINGKKSLLEWTKQNETINGYSNHLWNGITCLQLALIIKKIIDKKLFWKGIKHIYSPNIVSKYDLCVYINEIYNLNITINSTTETFNKTLKSIYKPLFEIEDIKAQIETQFYLLYIEIFNIYNRIFIYFFKFWFVIVYFVTKIYHPNPIY